MNGDDAAVAGLLAELDARRTAELARRLGRPLRRLPVPPAGVSSERGPPPACPLFVCRTSPLLLAVLENVLFFFSWGYFI